MLKLKKKKNEQNRERRAWHLRSRWRQRYSFSNLFSSSPFYFFSFYLCRTQLLSGDRWTLKLKKKCFVSICVEFYLVARLCDPFHRPKYLHLFRKKLFFFKVLLIFCFLQRRQDTRLMERQSSIKPERSTSEFHVKKKGNNQHSVVVLVCIKVWGFSRGGD